MKKFVLTILLAVIASASFADDYVPKISYGKVAPDFVISESNGVKRTLKDLRGKYVMLDFWASWCGDCRREMPEVIKLYNDFKDLTINDEHIEWIGVSFDTDEGAWERYLGTVECPWIQMCNFVNMKDSPIAKQYGISWIPSLILIDDKGFIVEKTINAADMRKELDVRVDLNQLPSHTMKRGMDVMSALYARHTDREFDARHVNQQDLSDILWAAVGVNRPNGNITSPTAMNRQEISVYVFDDNGAYLYDAKKNNLKEIARGDHRQLVAGSQTNFNSAPLFILFVGDMDKFQADSEQARYMVYADAGIAAENVNIFCASTGLKTCIRATMDVAAIRKLLGLTEKQIPMLNTAIGY